MRKYLWAGTVNLAQFKNPEETSIKVYSVMKEHQDKSNDWSFGWYECKFIGPNNFQISLSKEEWVRNPCKAALSLANTAWKHYLSHQREHQNA